MYQIKEIAIQDIHNSFKEKRNKFKNLILNK